MTDDRPTRSRDACPACGEHEIAVVAFPDISVAGVQPFNEIIGMGDAAAPLPGLECRSCGASWPSIEAFRAAVDAAPSARQEPNEPA